MTRLVSISLALMLVVISIIIPLIISNILIYYDQFTLAGGSEIGVDAVGAKTLVDFQFFSLMFFTILTSLIIFTLMITLNHYKRIIAIIKSIK